MPFIRCLALFLAFLLAAPAALCEAAAAYDCAEAIAADPLPALRLPLDALPAHSYAGEVQFSYRDLEIYPSEIQTHAASFALDFSEAGDPLLRIMQAGKPEIALQADGDGIIFPMNNQLYALPYAELIAILTKDADNAALLRGLSLETVAEDLALLLDFYGYVLQSGLLTFVPDARQLGSTSVSTVHTNGFQLLGVIQKAMDAYPQANLLAERLIAYYAMIYGETAHVLNAMYRSGAISLAQLLATPESLMYGLRYASASRALSSLPFQFDWTQIDSQDVWSLDAMLSLLGIISASVNLNAVDDNSVAGTITVQFADDIDNLDDTFFFAFDVSAEVFDDGFRARIVPQQKTPLFSGLTLTGVVGQGGMTMSLFTDVLSLNAAFSLDEMAYDLDVSVMSLGDVHLRVEQADGSLDWALTTEINTSFLPLRVSQNDFLYHHCPATWGAFALAKKGDTFSLTLPGVEAHVRVLPGAPVQPLSAQYATPLTAAQYLDAAANAQRSESDAVWLLPSAVLSLLKLIPQS